MSDLVNITDLAVLQELRFKVWQLEEEARRIMQRGMERFHRREEIYAAYAREHGKKPEGLSQEEKKDAILASIWQESED